MYAEEFRGLAQEDADRISRYAEYRDENEGVRSVSIQDQVADTRDYGRENSTILPQRHNIPMPFGQALTIKHGFRLFGRLPDTVVERREETEQERYRSDTMEKIAWAIIRKSGGDTWAKDGAWDGSQLGSSVFRLYWNEMHQLPCIKSVDPEGCYVVPGIEDVHDYEAVYRTWMVSRRSLIAEYGEDVLAKYGISLHNLVSSQVRLVERYGRKSVCRFILDGFDRNDDLPVLPIYERETNLGFVPYIVIPNIGLDREVWGWADYELVRGLVHYIPTLFSREADLIRAASGGAYHATGSKQTPGKILSIIRTGGVIPDKADSKLTAVEPPRAPDFEEAHAASAIEFLKMLGFAPDAAWGDGQAGSGSDRGLQLQPLLELTAMKQSNWAVGLQRLFDRAFRMLEKYQAIPTAYSGSKPGRGGQRQHFLLPKLGPDVEPATSEVPDPLGDGDLMEVKLPRNLKELFDGEYEINFSWQNRIDPDDPAFVNSELAKFQQGAQSLRTTLERLGCQNPEDEIKLIEEESAKMPWLRNGSIALVKAQLQAEAQQAGQGEGGGNPGDPAAGLMDGQDAFADADTAATDADFAARALPGGNGPLYGRA
jgi:hypothetical protein